MESIRVAPGLVLGEAQYVTAAAGVAAHAPALAPLTWEAFVRPLGWWLVPDKDGELSKAELTLRENRDRTSKINLWFLPDLRSARPFPHSHPWTFSSQILAGGYSETRYSADGGHVDVTEMEHMQGATSTVDRRLYHEVTALHAAPGGTKTLIVCGPGKRGAWGHLDLGTGRHVSPEADATFPLRLKALNPHRL
ncbi:hypothetical protein [Streptomyces sp. MNP-20]|uniref:hypothetical protein n=1 Tax=Streptomyces sp. MNP-20 TaxID=2721165 RepID=UPI00155340F3|nr:hypothetical protein [Streptomyces sp. MNP-20]